MTTTSIEDRVKKIIGNELCYDASEITPDKKLGRHLGANSLDIVHIELSLEEEFNIEITSVDMYRSMTVSDVFNLVSRLIVVAGTTK